MSLANFFPALSGVAHLPGDLDTLRWSWTLISISSEALTPAFALPSGCESLQAPCHDLLREWFCRGTITVKLIWNIAEDKRPSKAVLKEVGARFHEAVNLLEQKRNSAGGVIVMELTRLVGIMDAHISEAKSLLEDRSEARDDTLRQNLSTFLDGIGDEVGEQVIRGVMDRYKAHTDVGVILAHLEAYAKTWRELLDGKPTASVGFALATLSPDIAHEATTLSAKSRISEISSLSGELRAIAKRLGTEAGNLE